MYAFGQSTQIKGQCGSHGRLRGDFDSTGGMFHTSWDSHRQHLVTDDFKAELDDVVGALRHNGELGHVLKDRASMEKYCFARPGARFPSNLSDGYGFRVDTKERTYLLRCMPPLGDYNFYLYAYTSERLNQHVQNAAYGIRFIDSRYNELFRLKDGDKVRISTPDGVKLEEICRFIDETHVEVGSHLYHICEFAERMENNGNCYELATPAEPKEKPSAKGKSKPNQQER